ncbi:hypothetical protein EL17_02955 [Anditalea andensis]|uniref:Glycosyltransferase 2-like domain-containing protein n=1 Tax=Anditalea andensis TaxID=1048983 RepID=A0A074L2H3_9BACT|nr:hypothetical protein EL17_02955 [Anditalea andensis]
MSSHIVTVICTVYNHEAFVKEALDSVKDQSHTNLEIFIIDNGSQDNSRVQIEKWVMSNSELDIKVIIRDQTINYCSSFNDALFESCGAFIIDLSGDDVLLPGHIEASLVTLYKYPQAAVCFSDAEVEEADEQKKFYEMNKFGPPIHRFGYVYESVIAHYCISTVTLVFRADHLKSEGGYDGALVYEDFDILCRLSRQYPFCYNPHVGVKKRILPSSFSASQYSNRASSLLGSTLRVCQKIKQMNQTDIENLALYKRVMYEAFHALGSANFDIAKGFLDIARELLPRSLKLRIFSIWYSLAIDISSIYPSLRKLRKK